MIYKLGNNKKYLRILVDEFVKNRFKLNTVYKVTNGSIELITEELDEQRS